MWTLRGARNCTARASGPGRIHKAPPRRQPLAPPPPGSPTQRALEASSWKPPGHSHTAPPGRSTQRPLTQRHSSESSSELSSSAPAGRTQASTPPPAKASTPASSPPHTHRAAASPAAGGSHPRRNCSHSAMSGTEILGGAVSGQRGQRTSAPAPSPPWANPSRVGSPAPRGGHGRHWAPQPRPWRQQQSSKVRVGPARGPAHMPSSPRWAQHTSRCSGPRSAEGGVSGRSPKQGPPTCAPRLHTAEGPGVRADDPRPHQPGSRGAGSLGQRARAPRAGDTRSGRSPVG